MQPIPLVDVKAQYAPLLPELRQAIDEVLESGRFVFGPNVRAFESEAAAYLGVPETVGVANGTDAIVIVLDALGVGPGDEVDLPGVHVLRHGGGDRARAARRRSSPRSTRRRSNLDPEDVAARVTPRTKAIVPVHLFGRPAPLAELAELGIPIVEDAAQAFGSPEIAGVGIASTFSFYPSKNLFGLGDGGMVACRDEELAERIRLLRFHGSRRRRPSSSSATTRGSTRSRRRRSGSSCGSSTAGRGCGARPPSATASSASASWSSARRTSRATSTTSSSAARPSATASPPRCREAGIGHAAYYMPPLHLQPALAIPRLRAGLAARDRAGRARELLRCRSGPGSRPSSRSASSRSSVRRLGSSGDMTCPITRHRLWQLLVDAALIARRVVRWPGTCASTSSAAAATTSRYFVAGDRARDRDQARRLHPVRLLQPLVALRVDAGHVGRGARRRAASVLVDLVFYFVPPGHVRLPRAVVAARLAAPARVRRRLADARADGDGAAARAAARRAREGGRRRRRRRRGPARIRELLRNRALGYTPIGLVDDDPRKSNMPLHGVRVLGTIDDLPRVLREQRPDELLIAIPSASGEQRRDIVEAAQAAAVPVKTLPGLHELIAGDLNLAAPDPPGRGRGRARARAGRGRPRRVASYLEDEGVLVTGAGGSIGSELCRQIARLGASRLVLLDHSEGALFDIERELVDERGYTAAVPVLADVADRPKLRQVFEKYRPGVVFHAAAYKHVPLIEANPLECVRNNVARDARRRRRRRRVRRRSASCWSRPTRRSSPKNIMGQSKAICEWIVEAYGAPRDVATRFVAVRFGNVLGSSGSVIPIFRKQIARGGPVTVTHPEMTRFFMTIPEAVSLVIQAGAIGGRGEVFVLDMGEPVKIIDLAAT